MGTKQENPRHWRLKKQRYQLAGQECGNCKGVTLDARAVCPRCEMVFIPETETRDGTWKLTSHRVGGHKMRVYFLSKDKSTDKPISVALGIRVRELEKVR